MTFYHYIYKKFNLHSLILVFLIGLVSEFIHANKNQVLAADTLSNILPAEIAQQMETTEKGTTILGFIYLLGKPLPSATVILEELKLVINTSADGKFRLYPVKRGDYILKIYHPRAEKKEIKIRIRRNFFIKIDMERKIYRESLPMATMMKYPLDPLSLTRDSGQFSTLYPGIFGLSSTYFSTLPSISTPASYLEVPIVRGQNTQANRYYFNGMQIDYPFHGFGITSIFNKDDLREIKVYRGVTPVNYRDAGTAAFDLSPITLESSRKEYALRLNPLEIGSYLRTFVGESALFSISGQVTPILYDIDKRPYYHYNFQGTAAWELAKGQRIQLSSYGMGDHAGKLGDLYVHRNSETGFALRYDLDLTPFNKLTFQASYQNSALLLYGEPLLVNEWNDIVKREFKNSDGSPLSQGQSIPDGTEMMQEKQKKFQLETLYTMKIIKDQVVQAGLWIEKKQRSASFTADSGFLGFETENNPITDQALSKSILDMASDVLNFSGYVRYLAKLGKFGLDGGIRFTRFGESEKTVLEPAVLVFWYPTSRDKIYLGLGSYYQEWLARWEVKNGTKFNPLQPNQRSKGELGAMHYFLRELPVSIIFFGEVWKNEPILYEHDISKISNGESFQVFRSDGKGKAYGMEISGQYLTEFWLLRFSYSYTDSRLNEIESALNRTHLINLSAIYQLNKLWTSALVLRIWSTFPGVSANWQNTNEKDIYWTNISPVTEISMRFTRKLQFGEKGSRLFLEVAQFQNMLYFFQVPPRWEFSNTGALETATMGKYWRENKSIPDLPLMLGFGLEVVF